jgi:hypothetical protein
MGLETVFRSVGVIAQNVFDGVYVSARFEVLGSAVYDASAGVVSTTASSVTTTMLFEEYSNNEVDNDKIEPTDVKGTTSQTLLTVEPTLKHRVHRLIADSSAVYEILNVGQDPAGALWILHLRQS